MKPIRTAKGAGMKKVVVIGSVLLGILLVSVQPAGASPPTDGEPPTIPGPTGDPRPRGRQ